MRSKIVATRHVSWAKKLSKLLLRLMLYPGPRWAAYSAYRPTYSPMVRSNACVNSIHCSVRIWLPLLDYGIITIKCYYFLSRNVFGTGCQFAKNISTRGVLWRLESTEIRFRNPLPIPHSFDDFSVSAQSLWRLGPQRLQHLTLDPQPRLRDLPM